VNETEYKKGDLVTVVSWAEESWQVGDRPKYISKIAHSLAGKKAIFLLTEDYLYAKILGENGIVIVEKVFLRLRVPSY
tara:strand:+ start:18 stop:251 length:234 start_codon:yes stop_codon:yes gene_type:complete